MSNRSISRWRGPALAVALACLPAAASASQVATQWYFGQWQCTIDGRPARMVWRVVDNPQTTCQGDICSTTSGVAIRGSFSDNGSRWVPLTRPTVRGRRLTFRHADGNLWYLDQINANAANGETTWNGRRFPLRCTKQG